MVVKHGSRDWSNLKFLLKGGWPEQLSQKLLASGALCCQTQCQTISPVTIPISTSALGQLTDLKVLALTVLVGRQFTRLVHSQADLSSCEVTLMVIDLSAIYCFNVVLMCDLLFHFFFIVLWLHRLHCLLAEKSKSGENYNHSRSKRVIIAFQFSSNCRLVFSRAFYIMI